MAHSAGLTGATYASGTRGMPGGSAFTLTGVFVDRITPRLMAVGAAARAQAAQINAMGTKLGRMNAYMDRSNAALDRSRMKLKALAQQRMMLTRVYAAQNKEIAVGTRLATKAEAVEMAAFRTRAANLDKEFVKLQRTNAALMQRRALLGGGGAFVGKRLPTGAESQMMRANLQATGGARRSLNTLTAARATMTAKAASDLSKYQNLTAAGETGKAEGLFNRAAMRDIDIAAKDAQITAARGTLAARAAAQEKYQAGLVKEGVLIDKNAQKELKAAMAVQTKAALKDKEIKAHQKAMAQNTLQRRLLVGEETKYLAALKLENVQLDGQTKEELEQLGITDIHIKKIEQKIALQAIETRLLQDMNRQQRQRILHEQTLTSILAEQFALYGGMRTLMFGGAKLGAGLGIAAGAVSGISAIVAAGTMKDYEQSLARIGAIGQFSSQEKWGMGKYTTGLSQQYAMSPESMLGGSLVGVKAGYRDIAELQGMLVPSMQLAIVNGEELDKVMEQLIMTMNAFHLESSKANEVIANQQTLINNSLLQFSDYTDGMKYSAAWANELGLSYQEVGAMIATMTDAGVRAGISGRGLRRMFAKFADDMDIIAEKIKKGGTELDYFTEDGVLNIRALIESLSSGVNNVEEMQFALDRFGLRGAQPFLLLSQDLEKYDKLLSIQAGNTAELAEMAEQAQNTITGQWQLLKNMLREPLLTESLITQMRELVTFMREGGGMKDLSTTFASIVENSIRWLREGGLKNMVDILGNLATIFKGMQKPLLFITNLLSKIAKYWYLVLPIARMHKANTLLNMMARSVVIMAAARGGGAWGPRATGAGGWLGMTGAQMGRGSPGMYAKGQRVGGAGMLAGGAALKGLAVGGALGLGALGMYMLWKSGQDKQNEYMRDAIEAGGTQNSYNFYGDTYGIDDLNNKINEANTTLWSENERKL